MAKRLRLLELTEILRGRRTAITAKTLADMLDVSERTIYRDMDTLLAAGLAVEGEAGVGYRLRATAHLPPLMFEPDEAVALALGLGLVRAMTDPELAAAADRAERRVRAVLPDDIKRALDELPYRVPVTRQRETIAELHEKMRRGAREQRKIKIDYADREGVVSERVIWPLAIVCWGVHWTVLAWCELRTDYRNFRLDRMNEALLMDEPFQTGPELSYAHYITTHRYDFPGD